jgi:hypothetical protein
MRRIHDENGLSTRIKDREASVECLGHAASCVSQRLARGRCERSRRRCSMASCSILVILLFSPARTPRHPSLLLFVLCFLCFCFCPLFLLFVLCAPHHTMAPGSRGSWRLDPRMCTFFAQIIHVLLTKRISQHGVSVCLCECLAAQRCSISCLSTKRNRPRRKSQLVRETTYGMLCMGPMRAPGPWGIKVSLRSTGVCYDVRSLTCICTDDHA